MSIKLIELVMTIILIFVGRIIVCKAEFSKHKTIRVLMNILLLIGIILGIFVWIVCVWATIEYFKEGDKVYLPLAMVTLFYSLSISTLIYKYIQKFKPFGISKKENNESQSN